MKDKIKNILKNENFRCVLVLIVIALIMCAPMLKNNLDVYADDGIQHIARAYGTYEAIKEGVFLGNIIPNFSNNFGYSWNLFYGAFTTFSIILFKLISGSYIVAYKLFAFICMFLSGLFMYKLVSDISDNKNVGVLAGALYMMAPYHLTDLYVRNAIAEFASFMFIPLVFLGLYNIIRKEGKTWYLSIGAIGLIFTHNISTLYTAIFAIIYLLVNFKALKDKEVWKYILINALFIVTITACFTIPMLETRVIRNYRVYEPDAMVTEESLLKEQLPIRRIFVTANGDGGFVFELGPYMIIMLAFSIMTVRIMKPEFRKDYLFFLITGLLALLMATKLFPWKIMPKFLYIIQFPWRCMEYASFFLCVVAAINMGAVIKKYRFKDALIIITIATVYVMALHGFVKYQVDELTTIEDYNLGQVSGMNNECIAGMGKAEYLPSKAYENRFYIATREDRIYVTKGNAIISKEEKNGLNMTAKVETDEEETELELPYIYYPGYEIYADGIELRAFETENGFLGCNIPEKESLTLEVSYKGTDNMKTSMIISIIGFIMLVVYIWKMERER
ncbi:MAG: hypothetical protein J6A36_06180 [Clostridia bacterium]|nr:hypothetical protein [Clostridia bacterium]